MTPPFMKMFDSAVLLADGNVRVSGWSSLWRVTYTISRAEFDSLVAAQKVKTTAVSQLYKIVNPVSN